MNYYAAIKEAYPGITDSEFKLSDDGSGVYISEWTYQEAQIPNLSNLNARARELENLAKVQAQRKTDYPAIGEQLDMLYHAMDSGEIPKATDWYDAIKAVKDAHPKPTE